MARPKKINSHYDDAIARCSALKSINNLDLGNGLTVTIYETAIEDLRLKLNDYNTHLSLVDEKRNSVNESEKILRDLSERMLAGVASKFGKNSEEYEKAGGTKKATKRNHRKKLPTTA